MRSEEGGGAPTADGEQRCSLLLSRAAALQRAADLDAAVECAAEAAALARELGRADLLAAAALVIEPVGRPVLDSAVRRLCHDARAALAEDANELRARVTARWAETFVYLPDADAAAEASAQAMQIAEASKDVEAIAAALAARRVVRAGPDGLAERAGLAARLLTLATEVSEPRHELRAHLWQIDVSLERGDLGRVAAEIDAMVQCVWALGSPPLAHFEVLACRATLAQAQGRFDDARALLSEAFVAVAGTGHPAPHHRRAGLLSVMARHVAHDASSLPAGAFADASAETRETAGLIARISRAHMLLGAGRTEEASSLYASLGPVGAFRVPPHVRLFVDAFAIAIATATGRDGDVRVLRARLAPFAEHHVASGIGAVAYFGPVTLWLGIAAEHLGLHDDAVRELERAERACSENGAEPFRIDAHVELAGALTARGAPGDARRADALLAAARTRAAALGMAPIVAKIDGLARRERAGSQPLTRREAEVAALVAEGLTNRQIAKRLFVSERTAQNHVQHILTKLGLDNRSQIAVFVVRRK